jgi:hypothetical protein
MCIVIMDRTKDSCPPLPDKYLKVIVLGRFNPPAGGCAIMQAYNGNIVTAFEMWLGYLDYSFGSYDQEEEGTYNELLYCYSTMVRVRVLCCVRDSRKLLSLSKIVFLLNI